jgi:hypothetical protein
VVQLHRDVDAIHAAGAEIYVIGSGSPSFIEGFREHTKWPGPIYTDPSLEVFRAAQLKRGVLSSLDPRALGNTIGAHLRGHRQALRIEGDAWQQGGVLVVAPSGDIRWHHISDRPGDNASGRQILEALNPRS